MYSNREKYTTKSKSLKELNFVEFVCKYQNKLKNTQLLQRTDPRSVALRIPQGFSSNPKNDSHYLYCKYQLIKYKPWSCSSLSVLEGADDEPKSWINAWNSFLTSDSGLKKLPSWHKILNKPKSLVTIEGSDSEESEYEEDRELQEEWMRLQSDTLFCTVNGEKDVDNLDYWKKDRLKYSQEELSSLNSWLKTQKLNNIE